MCGCNNKMSNYTKCTECNPNPCNDCNESCGCDFKVPSECVVNNSDDLNFIGAVKGDSSEDIHIKINALLENLTNQVVLGFLGRNKGNGEAVFIGKDIDGYESFRSILSTDSINVTTNEDEILININSTWLQTFLNQGGNLPIASPTVQGIIEIATQAEVDAGTDTERAVTPATLKDGVTNILTDNTTNITIDPAQLPSATETNKGIAEIATQAEVDAGLDTERIVTPAKLKQGVTNILTDNTTNITIDPAQLPSATETNKGIIEIATQAEVDAGTDTERAVTPATLVQGVTTIVNNNNSSGGGLTLLPKYSIIEWGGNIATLPADWYICNGQTVNGFVTPDRRGKFTVEYDPSHPDYNTLLATGGIDENLLSMLNIPEHDHDILFQRANNDWDSDNSNIGLQRPGDAARHQRSDVTMKTDKRGSANPIPLDNRPAYIVTVHMIYLPQ